MNDFGLLISQYNSTLPTLADGQFSELQVDENGRLLVQADVTVKIDFLGLNAASDSANILIVGTEDGTASGNAHAIRVDVGGRLIIKEIVDTVDVNVTNTVTVEATDLGIRNLDFNSDSVTAHQGGSWIIDSITDPIEANVIKEGDEDFAGSDEAGNGLIEVPSQTYVDIVEISVGVGEDLHIYGYDFDADQNVTGRLVVVDQGTPVRFLKVKLNSSAMPGVSEHFADGGRIEIEGAADRTVRLQVAKRGAGGGTANASGSIHARKLL